MKEISRVIFLSEGNIIVCLAIVQGNKRCNFHYHRVIFLSEGNIIVFLAIVQGNKRCHFHCGL